jgi:hypothetical protein
MHYPLDDERRPNSSTVTVDFPFVPKSNTHLEPGQFWSIPLSDGRFACGRVLRIDRDREYGARSMFVAGLLDWVGSEPPTSESIAGAALLDVGHARVELVTHREGVILGQRDLALDGLEAPASISSYWGRTFGFERAERRFVAGDPPPKAERRRVSSPLTDEMLRPSATGRGVVQFNQLLTDADFERLADWLRAYPEMALRVYGSREIADLEFLRFFPYLRRFAADALWGGLASLDGLRHLPEDLEHLGLGATRRRLDLEVIGRFPRLRTLFLEGQTKNIEVVAGLKRLEELTLRSITLPDLSLLLPLKHLLALDLKLGGTKELGLLPEIGRIRYLELWRIKGLTDISSIARLSRLRSLFLQTLKGVTSLPDLSGARVLRRVHLETMKGICDLRPLATAPALRELVLVDMPQLQPDDLRPIVGLPRLKAATVALGSVRKNIAAEELLGLPQVRGAYDWRAG